MAWIDYLQPASWRSVPFAVDSDQAIRGRRVAVHEYPYREGGSVYVEDIGLGMRRYAFEGYLLGDDCYTQRDAMSAACEQFGTGELVHPSLGSLTVALAEPATFSETKEEGRLVRVSLSFIETPAAAPYNAASASTQDAVSDDADDLDDASGDDFTDGDTAFVLGGVGLQQIAAGIAGFVRLTLSVVNDAALLAHAVTGLAGSFGRYSNGALGALLPANATVATLIAAATSARGVVETTATSFQAVGSSLTLTTAPAFAAAAGALTESVRAVAVDPADQIRILQQLYAYAPAGSSPAAVAAAAVLRRATVASLARAAAAYQPTSSDDAIATMQTVCSVISAEIGLAGNAEDDASYLAMKLLRAAVAVDLMTRGAALAGLQSFSFNGSIPALALAYRLYGDATRSDDLVARVNPIHPAFMPTTFVALAN